MTYVSNEIRLYDKPIYKSIQHYIQDNNFITIKQCQNIFFSNSKFAYQEAQRLLNKMTKANLIKSFKTVTGENAYSGKKLKLSYHSIMKMNIYSMFIKSGFDIVYMSKEPVNFSIKRADIMMDIANPNSEKMYPLFIEVDNYNDTNIKTIEKLYDSEQVQNYYQQRYGMRIFPAVLIITNRIKKDYSDKFKIIYLDHNLSEFNDYFNIKNY